MLNIPSVFREVSDLVLGGAERFFADPRIAVQRKIAYLVRRGFDERLCMLFAENIAPQQIPRHIFASLLLSGEGKAVNYFLKNSEKKINFLSAVQVELILTLPGLRFRKRDGSFAEDLDPATRALFLIHAEIDLSPAALMFLTQDGRTAKDILMFRTHAVLNHRTLIELLARASGIAESDIVRYCRAPQRYPLYEVTTIIESDSGFEEVIFM